MIVTTLTRLMVSIDSLGVEYKLLSEMWSDEYSYDMYLYYCWRSKKEPVSMLIFDAVFTMYEEEFYYENLLQEGNTD